jgi:HK97 family phage major capsid protein
VAVGGAGGGTATAPDEKAHAAAIVKSREEARKEEQDRCRKIIALGTRHRMVDEANTAVDKGTRYDEFSEQVLDEISKRGDKKDQVSEGDNLGDFGKKSLGDLFIESEQYRELAKRGKNWSKQAGLVVGGEFKAPLYGQRATLTQAVSGLTKYERPPEMVLVEQQPLLVAQLFAPGTTENTTVRYLQEDTFTNAATALAEEGQYQEASWDLSEQDSGVKKIGVISRITDEQLEDSAQIASYINQRTPFMVMSLEDQHCVSGSGSNNQLKGILNVTGILSQSCNALAYVADAVHKALTKVRALSFFEPDFILMNPFDWENLVLTKDSNGQYLGGGPFIGAYGVGGFSNVAMMWGKPVVATTAMTRGTAIVGAFRLGGQLWRRRGINVQTTNSDNQDFQYGRQALRADVRDILAVYRPPAFCTVTDIPQP